MAEDEPSLGDIIRRYSRRGALTGIAAGAGTLALGGTIVGPLECAGSPSTLAFAEIGHV